MRFTQMSILVFLLGISFTSLSSQTMGKCGFDELVNISEEKFPGYKSIIDKTFDDARRINNSSYREDVLVIPMVIHVVYQNEDQNLSTERIQKVVNRLNEDFRHTNENASELRDVFKDDVGDPMIQFQINEIRRVSTTTVFEFDFDSFPEEVKVTAQGGSDAVDTERFLNVWICNVKGSILQGYAYPPACAPNWPSGYSAPFPHLDGVVVDYESFVTDLTLISGGSLIHLDGRTLTHEVGHYLGLRHIWGDAGSGENGCNVDDGITDTPDQSSASSNDCNPNQNSCQSQSNDKPDMIENYMDYSDETCMSAFTKGQISVMRNILMTCRSSVVDTGAVYISPGDVTNDAIIYPNPSDGRFDVEVSFFDLSALSFELFNSVGQRVNIETNSVVNNVYSFNLSTLPVGVYYLRITDENEGGTVVTKSFVKAI